jgi:two-component system, cell cycle response regulator
VGALARKRQRKRQSQRQRQRQRPKEFEGPMTQTVLAIDDLPEIHQLLEVRLRPEALRLQHALTAEEGMEKALKLQPDLILLDLDMPEVSGFDLCQRLKLDPGTALIPIIFLTGTVDVETKVRCFDLGAIDYVTKPFHPEELRARVRAALRTKRYQDLLAVRTQLDALTGIWNRAYFDRRMFEEIAAAARYKRKVCLLMIDIDHFKSLNDAYGHPFGDQVLQGVGDALSSSLRTTDAACRYGGEEFAIVLSETGLDGGVVAADRMQKQLEALEFFPRGQQVRVTGSFGVASTDQYSDASKLSASALIDAADRALYAAKQAGRNRVCAAKV